MRCALALHPDDAAKCLRLPVFGAAKSARRRHQVLRLVWHDSPDRALRAEGLALLEQRGTWRLEGLYPNGADWLPGQPAPLVAERGGGVPDHALIPHALAPVAAFDGRVTTIQVQGDDVGLTVRLLRGALRGVMATTPACRILVDGPDGAVRALILELAESVRLTVPRASLAAEAMTVAEGWVPPPWAVGAPRPVSDRTAGDAFAAVIGHLTGVLLHCAPLAVLRPDNTEPVHQMRVAVRRARSVMAVFRPALDCPLVTEASQALKALGAVLGPARDWDVFVTETLPPVHAAFPDEARLARLAAAAARQQAEANVGLRAWLDGPSFRRLTLSLAWLAGSRDWHAGLDPDRQALLAAPIPDFARDVLRQYWKRLRSAGHAIETLPIPVLHALRLRVKRTRYAMEVFVPEHQPKPILRALRRLSLLQERLGVLNDGAVAEGLLHQLGGPAGRHAYAVGLVMGFVAARAVGAQPRINAAWHKISRIAPFWT